MDAIQEKTLEGIIAEHAPKIKVVTTNKGSGVNTGSLSLTDRLWALNERLIDWYGIIVLVVLWEIGPRQGWIDIQFFPPPSLIIAEGLKMAAKDELLIQITSSMTRLIRGLGAALAVGIPLGFILGGWFPRLTHFLRPLLRLLGQINAFSLFPIFVLFFGIGELAKFAVIFWSCIWPILFSTIAGVQGVDPLYVKVARSMGSGSLTIFTRVLFPGALPSLFTGIRFGTTIGFLMLIAAEMIGATTGLGWLVHNSSMNYVIPRLYLAAALIAFLGMGMNYILHFLEARIITWKENAVEV
jgi:NitT/TauT family transport system permease protein